MALVTTFTTSPLTQYFYPTWYQKKVEAYRRGEIDWDGKPLDGSDSVYSGAQYEKLDADKIKRLTVYLRLDSMPNLLAFASLFGGQAQKQAPKTHPLLQRGASVSQETETVPDGDPSKRPVEAHGLRLLNLTDRGSSVMQVYETESYTAHDPIVNTFRTFGRLHNLAVSGEALVVPESSFAETLSARASDSDLLLLPWSETGGMSEQAVIEDKGTKNKLAASSYLSFVNATFEQASVTTAVLVNKNFGGPKNKEKKDRLRLQRTYSSVSLTSHEVTVTAPVTDKSHHIFFPFFGGADDRAALRLVLQLAESPEVTATVIYFDVPEELLARSRSHVESSSSPVKAEGATVTTTPQSRDQDATFFASLRASVPAELSSRVVFETVPSTAPLKDVIARASIEVGQNPRNGGDLIVLGRNMGWKELSVDAGDEISSSSSAAGTLGVLADKVWAAKMGTSVLVVKAGSHRGA
jgi:hypothetical protein